LDRRILLLPDTHMTWCRTHLKHSRHGGIAP
jgi:hypothetical protein